MSIKSLFDFTDYKEYLRAHLGKSKSNWGQIRTLADAAGCQRSYLSQVLNGPAQLTKDHAFGLIEHFTFNRLEGEFFMTLVEKERCGSAKYRKHLEGRLRELAKENDKISSKIEHARPLSSEAELVYYSAWYWAAIHILVGIPGYQTVAAVSHRLQLPTGLVTHCLEELRRFGMVEREKELWRFAGSSVHLPSSSPLTSVLHQNWRARALLDVQLQRDDSLHYSSLHSFSQKAYSEIRALLLRTIEESHAISKPTADEELACINIDFFRV